MAACRAAGIAVEVVPGISAAQGAAARLGVSLTHRRHARRVQYVTGHGEDGALPRDFDWRSVVDPATTTAVYMPAKTIAGFMQRAIAAGLDPATPAAAIACAARADEVKIVTTAAALPGQLAHGPQRGPVLVIIGRVLADAADASSAQRRTAA